jgi:hypothetical protein
MKPGTTNGAQFTLGLERNAVLEQEIEARVAERAKAEAWHWRFRLITVETIMMAMLIVAAGLCLGKPVGEILRAAILVGAACFASGILLLGLSAGAGLSWAALSKRWRRWRS